MYGLHVGPFSLWLSKEIVRTGSMGQMIKIVTILYIVQFQKISKATSMKVIGNSEGKE